MKLYTIDNVKLINLKVIDSNNANVNVFENIDKYFVPKRIFTIVLKEYQKDERGRHAHKIDHQIVSCPFGSIKFTVKDGMNTKTFHIDNQSKAVYVPSHIWTETDYLESKTVVTVFSSNPYDEKSYIRNFDDFVKIVNQKREIHKQ